MLIVLSLACSAAVVLSWKSWAEGFPRTYLWGRAGRRLIWSKAGGCKPAFPPTPCTHLPAPRSRALWAFARSPRQCVQVHKLIANSPARAAHFRPEQLLSCGCLGWHWVRCGHHEQCGKGSEPLQDWLGLPQSAGLWGCLRHLGALPPFPRHSHHQWWCSSLPHGVLPLPSTPPMLSVLHNTFLALTVQGRLNRGFMRVLGCL